MSGVTPGRLLRCALLGWLSIPASIALAVPPPPAPPLERLAQPIDGYDLQGPYQVWRYWVESQKGAATEALLAEPETIAGEQPHGAPLLRFTKHSDFGHFLTGEIRAYCRLTAAGAPEAGSCHYRLRRAFVPHNAAVYEGDNPVARWTRDSFDAEALAAHLRAAGIPADSDWWQVDRARLFAALPSAVPMLIENATVVGLDSRDCPGMGEAIAAIESHRLDWRLDLIGVGEDAPPGPPPLPHAIQDFHTLRIRVPGGVANIEGAGAALDAVVVPVLAAADACEDARDRGLDPKASGRA